MLIVAKIVIAAISQMNVIAMLHQKKIMARLAIDWLSTHVTIAAIDFVIFIVSQIYYFGKKQIGMRAG